MSGNNLVDDFLTGAPSQAPNHRASPPSGFGGGGGGINPSNFLTVINLQQRLVTVMKEAATIVAELQQLGVLRSDADTSPEDNAIEATQLLLASLLEQRRLESGGFPNAAPALGGGMLGVPGMPGAMPGLNDNEGNNTDPSALFAAPTRQQQQQQQQQYADAFRGIEDDAVLTAVKPAANEAATAAGGKSNAAAGGSRRGPRMLAFVEFKRNKVRKYTCDVMDVHPGTYVLVDGDRGTDCALLVQTIRYDDNGEAYVVCMDDCNIDDDKIKLENGRVLRAASNEDIDRLHNVIYNAEAVALKTCRQRCKELGIDIKVLDAEYQFDMKKISFYFDSDHSVDFRVLVRELYRTFGARIWMENVNPRVKNSVPDHGAGGNGHHQGGIRRRN